MTTYHLAELNIGRIVGDTPDDPRLAEFMAALDEINAQAEASPGFVWRLQDDSGNATSITAFDDPRMLLNISVWESVEALAAFAYKTDHAAFLARRGEWFEPPDGPDLVLWWVPAGHIPDTDEAKARLDLLIANGPTAEAFTFRDRFPAPAPAT
jgi:hypothetical protein